jgi:type IV secretory pathway VirB2 component (pilin)
MTPEIIRAWTQSVIAVVVVIGAGLLLMYSDVSQEAVIGIISLVVGYFFGSATTAPAPFHRKE